MNDFPQYDEIHVVSDLHMGGSEGFQIFRETKRLANYIRWVAGQRPGGRVALILNGDVIDTLAENITGYLAVDEAVSTVQRIMRDPSFGQIWDALADFVKVDGRALIIVIGNHDIELAFPTVQQAILNRLAGDNLAARARIEFSTTGAGYSCSVGGATIFCTHGNEVDPWNYVRYEDLSKVARRLNTGRPLTQEEWEPNAGTKMVKDVMNEVKRRYAWIDLLKPEIQAAVGTLLVLEPAQIAKINRLIPIIGEKRRGDDEFDKRLSGGEYQSPGASNGSPVTLDQLLGPSVVEGLQDSGAGGNGTSDDMLLSAEKNFDSRSTRADSTNGTLGTGQVIWDRLTGWITSVGQDEALRRALKDWTANDKTFQIDDHDDTYKAISASVGPSVDFIVTGHTHLERAIDMGAGRFYFNCGTWIRLLRLTDAVMGDIDSFRPVYKVLMNGRMDAIDAAIFANEPFVLDQTSAVSIKAESNQVVGRLTHVAGQGASTPQEIKTFARP
ncbi:MAG: metallophosphoesterase [Candidatus Binatia bacterium]